MDENIVSKILESPSLSKSSLVRTLKSIHDSFRIQSTHSQYNHNFQLLKKLQHGFETENPKHFQFVGDKSCYLQISGLDTPPTNAITSVFWIKIDPQQTTKGFLLMRCKLSDPSSSNDHSSLDVFFSDQSEDHKWFVRIVKSDLAYNPETKSKQQQKVEIDGRLFIPSGTWAMLTLQLIHHHDSSKLIVSINGSVEPDQTFQKDFPFLFQAAKTTEWTFGNGFKGLISSISIYPDPLDPGLLKTLVAAGPHFPGLGTGLKAPQSSFDSGYCILGSHLAKGSTAFRMVRVPTFLSLCPCLFREVVGRRAVLVQAYRRNRSLSSSDLLTGDFGNDSLNSNLNLNDYKEEELEEEDDVSRTVLFPPSLAGMTSVDHTDMTPGGWGWSWGSEDSSTDEILIRASVSRSLRVCLSPSVSEEWVTAGGSSLALCLLWDHCSSLLPETLDAGLIDPIFQCVEASLSLLGVLLSSHYELRESFLQEHGFYLVGHCLSQIPPSLRHRLFDSSILDLCFSLHSALGSDNDALTSFSQGLIFNFRVWGCCSPSFKSQLLDRVSELFKERGDQLQRVVGMQRVLDVLRDHSMLDSDLALPNTDSSTPESPSPSSTCDPLEIVQLADSGFRLLMIAVDSARIALVRKPSSTQPTAPLPTFSQNVVDSLLSALNESPSRLFVERLLRILSSLRATTPKSMILSFSKNRFSETTCFALLTRPGISLESRRLSLDLLFWILKDELHQIPAHLDDVRSLAQQGLNRLPSENLAALLALSSHRNLRVLRTNLKDIDFKRQDDFKRKLSNPKMQYLIQKGWETSSRLTELLKLSLEGGLKFGETQSASPAIAQESESSDHPSDPVSRLIQWMVLDSQSFINKPDIWLSLPMISVLICHSRSPGPFLQRALLSLNMAVKTEDHHRFAVCCLPPREWLRYFVDIIAFCIGENHSPSTSTCTSRSTANDINLEAFPRDLLPSSSSSPSQSVEDVLSTCRELAIDTLSVLLENQMRLTGESALHTWRELDELLKDRFNDNTVPTSPAVPVSPPSKLTITTNSPSSDAQYVSPLLSKSNFVISRCLSIVFQRIAKSREGWTVGLVLCLTRLLILYLDQRGLCEHESYQYIPSLPSPESPVPSSHQTHHNLSSKLGDEPSFGAMFTSQRALQFSDPSFSPVTHPCPPRGRSLEVIQLLSFSCDLMSAMRREGLQGGGGFGGLEWAAMKPVARVLLGSLRFVTQPASSRCISELLSQLLYMTQGVGAPSTSLFPQSSQQPHSSSLVPNSKHICQLRAISVSGNYVREFVLLLLAKLYQILHDPYSLHHHSPSLPPPLNPSPSLLDMDFSSASSSPPSPPSLPSDSPSMTPSMESSEKSDQITALVFSLLHHFLELRSACIRVRTRRDRELREAGFLSGPSSSMSSREKQMEKQERDREWERASELWVAVEIFKGLGGEDGPEKVFEVLGVKERSEQLTTLALDKNSTSTHPTDASSSQLLIPDLLNLPLSSSSSPPSSFDHPSESPQLEESFQEDLEEDFDMVEIPETAEPSLEEESSTQSEERGGDRGEDESLLTDLGTLLIEPVLTSCAPPFNPQDLSSLVPSSPSPTETPILYQPSPVPSLPSPSHSTHSLPSPSVPSTSPISSPSFSGSLALSRPLTVFEQDEASRKDHIKIWGQTRVGILEDRVDSERFRKRQSLCAEEIFRRGVSGFWAKLKRKIESQVWGEGEGCRWKMGVSHEGYFPSRRRVVLRPRFKGERLEMMSGGSSMSPEKGGWECADRNWEWEGEKRSKRKHKRNSDQKKELKKQAKRSASSSSSSSSSSPEDDLTRLGKALSKYQVQSTDGPEDRPESLDRPSHRPTDQNADEKEEADDLLTQTSSASASISLDQAGQGWGVVGADEGEEGGVGVVGLVRGEKPQALQSDLPFLPSPHRIVSLHMWGKDSSGLERNQSVWLRKDSQETQRRQAEDSSDDTSSSDEDESLSSSNHDSDEETIAEVGAASSSGTQYWELDGDDLSSDLTSNDQALREGRDIYLGPAISGSRRQTPSSLNQPQYQSSPLEAKVILITASGNIRGKLSVSDKEIWFQSSQEKEDGLKKDSASVNITKKGKPRRKKWLIAAVQAIYLRRFRLRDSALEVFFRRGKHRSFFVDFGHTKEDEKLKVKFSKHLMNLAPKGSFKQWPSLSPSQTVRENGNLQERWVRGEISNFDYLMGLNTLAGRSFNDLCQYPVMPWVLSNYRDQSLDLQDSRNYRDLSKPVGALNEARLQDFLSRYHSFEESTSSDIPPFMYGSHYSTMVGVVLHFLVRLEPFASLHKEMQGGHFDVPDRLFASIPRTYDHNTTQLSEVKELTPEWFTTPEMFRNCNHYDFGTSQDGERIGDVALPPWARTPEEFVRIHREALESDTVSRNLHHWIDLIFGYKQQGKAAVDANNVFYYLTYYGRVDREMIQDDALRRATELQIAHFGQTPAQLFRSPHPARKIFFKTQNALSLSSPSQIPSPPKSIEDSLESPSLLDLDSLSIFSEPVSTTSLSSPLTLNSDLNEDPQMNQIDGDSQLGFQGSLPRSLHLCFNHKNKTRERLTRHLARSSDLDLLSSTSISPESCDLYSLIENLSESGSPSNNPYFSSSSCSISPSNLTHFFSTSSAKGGELSNFSFFARPSCDEEQLAIQTPPLLLQKQPIGGTDKRASLRGTSQPHTALYVISSTILKERLILVWSNGVVESLLYSSSEEAKNALVDTTRQRKAFQQHQTQIAAAAEASSKQGGGGNTRKGSIFSSNEKESPSPPIEDLITLDNDFLPVPPPSSEPSSVQITTFHPPRILKATISPLTVEQEKSFFSVLPRVPAFIPSRPVLSQSLPSLSTSSSSHSSPEIDHQTLMWQNDPDPLSAYLPPLPFSPTDRLHFLTPLQSVHCMTPNGRVFLSPCSQACDSRIICREIELGDGLMGTGGQGGAGSAVGTIRSAGDFLGHQDVSQVASLHCDSMPYSPNDLVASVDSKGCLLVWTLTRISRRNDNSQGNGSSKNLLSLAYIISRRPQRSFRVPIPLSRPRWTPRVGSPLGLSSLVVRVSCQMGVVVCAAGDVLSLFSVERDEKIRAFSVSALLNSTLSPSSAPFSPPHRTHSKPTSSSHTPNRRRKLGGASSTSTLTDLVPPFPSSTPHPSARFDLPPTHSSPDLLITHLALSDIGLIIMHCLLFPSPSTPSSSTPPPLNLLLVLSLSGELCAAHRCNSPLSFLDVPGGGSVLVTGDEEGSVCFRDCADLSLLAAFAPHLSHLPVLTSHLLDPSRSRSLSSEMETENPSPPTPTPIPTPPPPPARKGSFFSMLSTPSPPPTPTPSPSPNCTAPSPSPLPSSSSTNQSFSSSSPIIGGGAVLLPSPSLSSSLPSPIVHVRLGPSPLSPALALISCLDGRTYLLLLPDYFRWEKIRSPSAFQQLLVPLAAPVMENLQIVKESLGQALTSTSEAANQLALNARSFADDTLKKINGVNLLEGVGSFFGMKKK